METVKTKHPLNIPWIHFHIREALGVLRELEAWLEYLETGKQTEMPPWMTEDKIRFCCENGSARDSFIEIHLNASLAHAYHHMNFGWNSRRSSDTRLATDQFSRNENFPRPSESGWDFHRFWSKRCLQCLAEGKNRKETKTRLNKGPGKREKKEVK